MIDIESIKPGDILKVINGPHQGSTVEVASVRMGGVVVYTEIEDGVFIREFLSYAHLER